MIDAIRTLAHDHDEMNRRVLTLSASIRALAGESERSTAQTLEPSLLELRELVFLHFAREEEGLFPLVAEIATDLEGQVQGMAVSHDTICGALARMVHLASIDAPLEIVASVFERFEAAYSEHARSEADLLTALEARLDAAQLARLGALIDGL